MSWASADGCLKVMLLQSFRFMPQKCHIVQIQNDSQHNKNISSTRHLFLAISSKQHQTINQLPGWLFQQSISSKATLCFLSADDSNPRWPEILFLRHDRQSHVCRHIVKVKIACAMYQGFLCSYILSEIHRESIIIVYQDGSL